CGILITRLIQDYWTGKKRHFQYFSGISKKIFQKANFDFMKARKVTYIISACVVVLGVLSFFLGFNTGVEFSGGRSYTVRFDQPVQVVDVRNALNEEFGDFPVVKTVNTSNQLNITTAFMIDHQGKQVDSIVEHTLYAGL